MLHAAMAEHGDMDELARRYLDLWQDQVSALAADPELGAAVEKLMAGFAAGPAAAWSAWPGILAGLMTGTAVDGQWDGRNSKARDEGGADGRFSKNGAAPAAGASPAATAPDGGGADLGDIARRLALLEQRLAALESEPAPKGKRNRRGGG